MPKFQIKFRLENDSATYAAVVLAISSDQAIRRFKMFRPDVVGIISVTRMT